jgi:molybdopterin converting factor small subunit
MDEDSAQKATDNVRVKFSDWGPGGNGGLPSRTVVVPVGTTLDGLLRHLSTLTGSDVHAATAREGTRFVVLNGGYCVMPRDAARRLEDGDEVALLPFVAGG